MKRTLFYTLMFCALCFSACTKEEPIGEKEYIDLGLPSGILWCNQNEASLYNYGTAIRNFGSQNIPSSSEWKELFNKCTRTWTGKGYKLIGPNGKSIYLPADGMINGVSGIKHNDCGFYWANGYFSSGYAYGIYFTEYTLETDYGMFDMYPRDDKGSIRLVQHNK